MADCNYPSSNYPNAATMRQMAIDWSVVWEEICMIQQAILSASSQCQPGGGQLCTTIGGSTPMTFVSGISSITVVNGGSGYYVDTPSIQFIPPLGSPTGSGASANVITNGSSVLQINMVSSGSGYEPVPASINILTSSGIGGELIPLVDASGRIISVDIVNGGSGYLLTDSLIPVRALAPNPYYLDAQLKISTLGSTGEIVGVSVLYAGTGYSPSVTEARIVSSLNPDMIYPIGSGFQSTVLVDNSGAITGVSIENGGAGYANFNPYLVINDPGSGAQTQVTLSGTSVQTISVTNPGNNYTTSATGVVKNPPTAGLPNPPVTQAQVTINTNVNTYGTDPILYWQVWNNVVSNKQINAQINSVISYFKGLGYTIIVQDNPLTNNTIQWKVCW